MSRTNPQLPSSGDIQTLSLETIDERYSRYLLNGRTFRSLEHLNEVTAWWLAEAADVRTHRTTQKRPLDLHVEEQPRLIPLPSAPYEVAEVVYRTVDHEGYVSHGQNRYSVPWDKTHPGQVLPVKITEEQVILYGLHLSELTRHTRLPGSVTHQTQQKQEHRPPRDTESRRQLARQQFQELGESAVAFLEGLLRTQRRGWEQARKILACLRNYRREDLLAALQRATRFGAFSLGAVERILAVQARPKTSYEHLADQTLPQQIRYWSGFDLLILDEFGFDKLERAESPQAANLALCRAAHIEPPWLNSNRSSSCKTQSTNSSRNR